LGFDLREIIGIKNMADKRKKPHKTIKKASAIKVSEALAILNRSEVSKER